MTDKNKKTQTRASNARVFFEADLQVGVQVSLDVNAAHYLMRVLRASVGDTITLFNGGGCEYSGEIVSISKRDVVIEINNKNDRNCESPLHTHLAQVISRGEKMDFTLQKSVELGVSEITPLLSERCGVKLSKERQEKRMQHWRAVIISACEQCGRNTLPILNPIIDLPQFLTNHSDEVSLICHPFAALPLSDLKIKKGSAINYVIGPEGGFDEKEIVLAKENNFQLIALGPRVLRTETASLAVLSSLQMMGGDF